MPPAKRPSSTAVKGPASKKTRPPSSSIPKSIFQLQPVTRRYTQSELKKRDATWNSQYQSLLAAARSGSVLAGVVLPTLQEYRISMVKECKELNTKVELLDIYHYLVSIESMFAKKVTYERFGHMIGISLKSSTLGDWLKNEDKIRQKAPLLPAGAKNMVNMKNNRVETIVLHWLQQQRKNCVPVSGKMIRKAADTTYFVLQDSFEADDQDDGVVPSFSAAWFDSFKKRHQISYCQLRGEAGSVNIDAIEPELVEIRNLCSYYRAEDIYNCDETGLYLKELNTKSYTVPDSKAGGKPLRECRVSLLMCVNASGSSITLSKERSSLRPLLIARNRARDVDSEALKLMTIRITNSGWMTGSIFMEWLRIFDDQLDRPSLLLLDSCPAHNNIDMRDQENGIPWKFLRIQRLPKNSTSMTQPLDAGCFSVFKRAYLEMLSQETCITVNHGDSKSISNGHAWSLLPYAWNRVKASTIRNCFAHVPILPPEIRDDLRRRRPRKQEQLELTDYTKRNQFKEKELTDFEHLIATVGKDNNWNLKRIGEKDRQQLADEELALQPDLVEDEGAEEVADYPTTPQRTRASSYDNVLYSSPIVDEDFEDAFSLLNDPEFGFSWNSPAGVRRGRESMLNGSAVEKEFRGAAKEFFRKAARVSAARREADMHRASAKGDGEENAEEEIDGDSNTARYTDEGPCVYNQDFFSFLDE